VRDDEIRRVLTDANPWWRAAGAGDPAAWTTGHRLLRDRHNHDLGYRPTSLADIALGPVTDQLVVLTGPRRIGKSVTLLDTAAALCGRDDVDPRRVVHLPCDGMRDRDLRRALTLGRPSPDAGSAAAVGDGFEERAPSPLLLWWIRITGDAYPPQKEDSSAGARSGAAPASSPSV
jgi:hypothetical protein